MVLIDEQYILLEAGVEVRFQPQLADDGVVMAVDVGVDTIHALEDLADVRGEGLGEGDACGYQRSVMSVLAISRAVDCALTDTAGQHRLVVNGSLNPSHQLLDIGRCRHLGRFLVVLVVLPEVLEPNSSHH
jgi:hypothetical protein